jgi:hypothetical protein
MKNDYSGIRKCNAFSVVPSVIYDNVSSVPIDEENKVYDSGFYSEVGLLNIKGAQQSVAIP